ncbi:hypothetical protein AAC387_Pa02g1447 [Persea americana]
MSENTSGDAGKTRICSQELGREGFLDSEGDEVFEEAVPEDEEGVKSHGQEGLENEAFEEAMELPIGGDGETDVESKEEEEGGRGGLID